MTDIGTVDDLFRRTVRWYPNEQAFEQANSDVAYTYAEADDRMCRVANALTDRGVEKGDRVACLAHTIVDQAIAFLACQKIGALPANVHAREAPAVIVEMIADVEPTAFVFQPEFADVAERVADEVESVELLVSYDHDEHPPEFAAGFSELVASGDSTQPDVRIDQEDRAFISFSSGTTSQPKPIVHRHSNAIEAARVGLYHYNARDYDVGLLIFGPSFIGWVNQILTWTSAGACALCLEHFDPERAVELVDERNVTSLLMVPVHLRQLLAAGLEDADGDSVRVFGYAGEPVEAETIERAKSLFPRAIYTGYGSTEVMTSIVHCSSGHLDPHKPRAIGRPLPSADVRVIEPGSRDPTAEVPQGEVGELALTGPSVAREVWERPDLTEELFHEDGWWFSGDLARVGDDDMLYLEGRTDNMIISGGINVQAERVESILRQHENVVDCGVVGTPSEKWGEVVTAYVVADGDLDEANLDTWCRANDDLADYQRPRRYEFLEELPKTDSGKLSRQALRERAEREPNEK
jgi:long-chain acyl-CoA synthetase